MSRVQTRRPGRTRCRWQWPGLRLRPEGSDADHRAEDFFLEHTHLVVTLDQGRLRVVTGGQAAFELLGCTAGEDLRAFLLGDFHVGKDLVELLLGRLGADHGVGIQRVAALDRLDLLHHHFHEGLEDRFLNQRTRRAGADLALVEEGQYQTFSGFLDERRLRIHDVFEEDVRALATQFHGAGDDVLGRATHDVRANRGRAGKGDLGNAGAGRQRLTSFAAEALDDVQHARWQQVTDDLDQNHDRQRSLFGRQSTMQLPAARAGASFQAAISSGKFHGMICPTTPSGSWK